MSGRHLQRQQIGETAILLEYASFIRDIAGWNIQHVLGRMKREEFSKFGKVPGPSKQAFGVSIRNRTAHSGAIGGAMRGDDSGEPIRGGQAVGIEKTQHCALGALDAKISGRTWLKAFVHMQQRHLGKVLPDNVRGGVARTVDHKNFVGFVKCLLC